MPNASKVSLVVEMHHNEACPVNYDGRWSSMKVQNQVRILVLRLALRPFMKSNNDGTPQLGNYSVCL